MIITIKRHVNVRYDWRGEWGVRLRGKCTSWFEVRTGVESRREYLPWLQCGKCMVTRFINILLHNIYWAVATNDCFVWNYDILCSIKINTTWKQKSLACLTPHYFLLFVILPLFLLYRPAMFYTSATSAPFLWIHVRNNKRINNEIVYFTNWMIGLEEDKRLCQWVN
jgi:hypothetical protein